MPMFSQALPGVKTPSFRPIGITESSGLSIVEKCEYLLKDLEKDSLEMNFCGGCDQK
jgi:hypothetical protein